MAAKKKSVAANRAETALTVQDEGKLLAMMPTASKGIEFGGKEFKLKKLVTVPHLKHEEGMIVGIKITGKIYTGKDLKPAKGDAPKEKPAQIAPVINLADGNPYTYIFAAVVESNLNEMYPKDTYVGKSFAIMKGPKAIGKRYHQYGIMEIDE